MSNQKEMTFLEHIKELRDRIKVVAIFYIASLIFWLVFPRKPSDLTAIAMGEYTPFITLVLEDVRRLAGTELNVIAGRLTTPLEIYFIASALMALITSAPVIAYEFYKYVDPALYPHERKTLYGFMAAFAALYTIGAFISYKLIVPLIIRFMVLFAKITNVTPEVLAGDYYSLVFMSVALMGLVFTAPAIFVLLVKFGIIKTSSFTNNRLYIYGLLYIMIAIITPDGWLVGNTLLFLPIVALLEIAVIIAKRYEKMGEGHQQLSNWEGCKFCGGYVPPGGVFCSECGRAQV